MKQRVFRIVKNGASPKASPSPTLSQTTSRLIERWNEMSEEEKLAIQVIIDWDEVMQSRQSPESVLVRRGCPIRSL